MEALPPVSATRGHSDRVRGIQANGGLWMDMFWEQDRRRRAYEVLNTNLFDAANCLHRLGLEFESVVDLSPVQKRGHFLKMALTLSGEVSRACCWSWRGR
jgi:hypothetical protein